MDLPDCSSELDDLLEPLAYYTSIFSHQPTGSQGGFMVDDSDHLVTVPCNNRHRTLADSTVWPTHVLQLGPRPMYQWAGSTYMDSYSLANHTMEISIPRPCAPFPILAMQDNLLQNFNFFDFCGIPPLRSPPRSHCTTHFEPYHSDRTHKHHGTFLCRWDNDGTLCGDELQASPGGILAHLRQDHGIGIGDKKTYRCLWITAQGRCEEELKFQSLGRHVIKHTGIRMKCSVCGMMLSARKDLTTRHRKNYPNCSQADFIFIPGRNTEASF
ncbi:hypothetical protein BDR04DRAFT_673950 [Suillus decipiens]|nr:hypothetical protein BDR04DRAFT_673950 [Suillus decipiens]